MRNRHRNRPVCYGSRITDYVLICVHLRSSAVPKQMADFMFATGIENSYPTIAGGQRVDEMEKCGHYERWQEDLALVREMGLRFLRWGPALYKVHTGPERYDWAWTDAVMAEMARLEIVPIVDLCHFGVPDWLGN